MSDSLFSDISTLVTKKALDGLSLRQQAISRNLSNVDTPGYTAQTINFADTLKHITEKSGDLPLTLTDEQHLDTAPHNVGFQLTQRAGGSFRADGNNVDVDVEMLDMSETGIEYQAITQAVSKKLLLLKTLAK